MIISKYFNFYWKEFFDKQDFKEIEKILKTCTFYPTQDKIFYAFNIIPKHRIMPQDATVAEHLGDAYMQQKRYREALRLYRKAAGLENADTNQLRKKIKKLEELQQRQGI